ncbi:hypothetical protein N1030_01760 [Desulfovibrio mangrovi]|uniref:glycoside hydrolase family 108 protein n=1 Tax=Desulfovibrio mangrovi TaxID=2976983 RepID=UPI0022481D1F|nr:glycosyl hydrolase 108 family protein [Desulfovibrio mangrovi]UZP67721.1 hypothetical protein N1030_01760 [Desulfovibrio mangrovi]
MRTTFTPEFNRAFAVLMGHEGGYSNSATDRGGETYKGISRVHHPAWQGWPMVDGAKAYAGFPVCLESNALLQTLVKDFYKGTFWDHFYCDSLPLPLALEVFEQAVNLGIARTARHLQQACNALNRNGKLFADLKEDGKFGRLTLQAVSLLVHRDDMDPLIKALNILQGAHYLAVMREHPEQETYARGWLSRVEITSTTMQRHLSYGAAA